MAIIRDPKVTNNIKGKPYSWYHSQSGRKNTFYSDKSVKAENLLIEIDKMRKIFE